MYRVMIVEDDDIIAGTVKKHLEQWQYDVHIAADLSNVMGVPIIHRTLFLWI